MKNYKQLKLEFEGKLKSLQKNCKHEKLVDLEDCWIMGSAKRSHEVGLCSICNKIIIRRKK